MNEWQLRGCRPSRTEERNIQLHLLSQVLNPTDAGTTFFVQRFSNTVRPLHNDRQWEVQVPSHDRIG
jgi:hypothetical protein